MSPTDTEIPQAPASPDDEKPMEVLEFWRLKLLQLFHDPPGKPFYFRARKGQKGGHKGGADALVKELIDAPRRVKIFARPDRVMTGADRAVLPRPPGAVTIGFTRSEERLLTHPLCAGPLLQPGHGGDVSPEEQKSRLEDEQEVAAELKLSADEWNNPQALQAAYLRLWRRFHEELIRPETLTPDTAEPGDLLWERMPADTRQPDHAIWDHNRLTSALAFMRDPMPPRTMKGLEWLNRPRYTVPESRTPWLLTLSLGPVQDFIAESRKSQDLWVSSMMLADLFLHTLAPLIRAYGPDCVLYPDLRGNPHFDRWWLEQQKKDKTTPKAGLGMLPDDADPSTFAGILPNTAVVVVPLGLASDGHGTNTQSSPLIRLEKLANDCQQAMNDRWRDLAKTVRDWLEQSAPLQLDRLSGQEGLGKGPWQQLWDAQSQTPRLHVTWSAVAWQPRESRHVPPSHQGALPGQDWSQEAVKPAGPPPDPLHALHDAAADQSRQARLKRWVPDNVWNHYELTREVFAKVNLDLLQQERGFDYALLHHQLFARHALRKLAGRPASLGEERGEKCTLCRTRSALHGAEKLNVLQELSAASQGRPMAESERQREQVRLFWRALDREGMGSERLCMVCTLKRFLIPAGGKSGGINPVWAGNEGALWDNDSKARVPFPSSTTIAAQQFLTDLCDTPALLPQLQAVVKAYARTGLPRTSFPRALPQLLKRVGLSREVEQFLMLEPQLSIIPETSERMAHREGKRRAEVRRDGKGAGTSPESIPDPALMALSKAVKDLRTQAKQVLKDAGKVTTPVSRYALIRLDGDQISQLLLGDPESLKARWRDVLHPKMVESIEKSEPGSLEHESGWPTLLNRGRLMGPSLHAFLNRVLADFSHRIVPWVVEREFDGRLIYAGGDDVLALAPADQALPLVARLQQVYSSAWIIDTDHRPDAWGWRRQSWGMDKEGREDSSQQAPQLRFVALQGIPSVGKERHEPVPVPLSPSTLVLVPIQKPLQRGAARRQESIAPLARPVQGPVLPMMGPHHTLSAAIVYAHFKTPIGDLLKHSKVLLDETAKESTGRGAVALARYSRNGTKEVCALQWHQVSSISKKQGEEQAASYQHSESVPPAHEVLARVQEAFQRGTLSGRFPYKLREWMMQFEPLMRDILNDQESDETRAIYRRTGEPTAFADLPDADVRRKRIREKRKSLHNMMIGAISLASDKERPSALDGIQALDEPLRDALYLWEEGLQLHADDLTRSLDGLLLCRALASSDEEDET